MMFLGEIVLIAFLITLVQSQTPMITRYPTKSSQASSSIGGPPSLSAIGNGSSTASSNGVASLPLPSLATIVTSLVRSQTITETFVPHIFPQYTTLSATITTTTTLTSGSNPVTVVVGPLGVGWAPYHEPSGALQVLPPSILPPSGVAASDDASTTTAGTSIASVLLGNRSSTITLGTGIRASSPSANPSSRQSPTSILLSSPSVLPRPGVSSASLTSSQSAPLETDLHSSRPSSSQSVPLGTGSTSLKISSSSNVPTSTNISASNFPDSRISLGTGSSGASLSNSASNAQSRSNGGANTSGSITHTTQAASASRTASPGSSSSAAIVPVSYVTTAFNNPSQEMTTLSMSGKSAIIYSKETIAGLSTITAPTTVQTSVIETEKNGKTSTFIGGIVVGPGGVYWGPPRFPAVGGAGGSDPLGDPDPPPPYSPDDPNPPHSNDPETASGPSSQPSSTPSPSATSKPSTTSQSSSVISSASCSSRTITNYWVSCASGAST